jgi:hypothetical protein
MSRAAGAPSQEPPETTPPLGAAGDDEGACAGAWSPPPLLLARPLELLDGPVLELELWLTAAAAR